MVGLLTTLVKAGIVFGLLAVTIKLLRRYDRRSGTTGGRRSGAKRGSGRRSAKVLDVVERAPLGRAASVVLVRVQDQHWVLGVTEQQITMLLEVDLPEPETIDLRSEHPLAELARQAKQYLPSRSRVELIDPPSLPTEETS